VYKLGAFAAGAATEVIALDHSNFEATSSSVEGDASTSGAASNNEHIILLNVWAGALAKVV
jgi:hypothetical protein